MSGSDSETIVHASAVAVGDSGVLIRGKAGSGKSSLALALIDDPKANGQLIADDQVHLVRSATGITIHPAPRTAGLIEMRGIGIVPMPHRDAARLALVVDLVPAAECPRMPEAGERVAAVLGQEIARLALPIGAHDGSLRVRTALRRWIGPG